MLTVMLRANFQIGDRPIFAQCCQFPVTPTPQSDLL
jgi:hypothetical protein